MNKSLEILKAIYKPYRYTIKGKTTILETTSGDFIIKPKNKDINELYNYLTNRGFMNFPKIIDASRDEVNVFEYVEDTKLPKEQKCEDLIELIRYNPTRMHLLTDRNFNQLKTQGIRNIWYDALNVAKIEKRYVPHSCRHMVGSRLVEKNIPLKKVANILGHSTSSTAERYYTKKVEDFRDDLNKVDIFD